MESSRGECERRIGEIKRWVRRMSKLTEVFWESVTKSWCSVGKGAELQRGSIYGIYIAPLQGNYSEALPAQARTKRKDETGGRDKERYDDEQVDPGG